MSTGRVILVGAGPGDPELITLKGVRALQQADVVLYDRLAHPDLLQHAPPQAERIDVGKAPGKGGTPKQHMINALLIAHARAGRTVVRLKGGDPFVFGRGGEEILALRAEGIAVEVIPGISSAIAVPELAFIPVTHRHVAAAFGVFSAHAAADAANTGPDDTGVDWAAAARMPTAVFLMGVEALPVIVAQLRAHGRAADTPVAVIEQGTLPGQRVIVGTLADIMQACGDVRPPAIIVVGDVVRLREALAGLNAGAVLEA
jgi:uroporphyrin-III C-methyltransferase